MNREIERLLDHSSSTHGFWLINHVDVIREDLLVGLERHGLTGMVSLLKDWQGDYTKGLYEKIREATLCDTTQ